MTVTWTGFLLPCGRTKANAPCLAVRSLPVEIRYIVIVEEGSLKTPRIRQVKVFPYVKLCLQLVASTVHKHGNHWALM